MAAPYWRPASPCAGILTLLWFAVVLVVDIRQQATFVRVPGTARYRLVGSRRGNDLAGRLLGCLRRMLSLCIGRVTRRLHHNHLCRASDLAGLTAWKTYAYFFARARRNSAFGTRVDPLSGIPLARRAAALDDRLLVLLTQASLPLGILAAGEAQPPNAYRVLRLVARLTVVQRLRAMAEPGALPRPAAHRHCRPHEARTWAAALGCAGSCFPIT